MSGYHTYTRWQRFEERAKKFGFRLANPKHGWQGSGTDYVALYPDGEKLPIYSRDAELFIGTFHDAENWLAGWERALAYDDMLRLTNDKKRAAAEAKELERQRIAREKAEQRKTFALLADKTEAEVEKLERKRR